MPEGHSQPVPDTPAAPDVPALARRLYRDAGPVRRFLQTHRDRICPFAPLLEQVPLASRVLDVGCGAGLFVLLLAVTGRADAAVGIDVDAAAIAAAQRAARHLGELAVDRPERFAFRHVPPGEPLPEGPFDVVSLIDVMHHVPPGRHREFLAAAVARVRPGGILLYKDMCRRPLWRAWANRMHDLLLARQWIHYVPLARLETWAGQEGLHVVERRAYARLVYGHELLVMRKGGGGPTERSRPAAE